MLGHFALYGGRLADRLCLASAPTGRMWWTRTWFGVRPHEINALNAHAAARRTAAPDGPDAG